MHYYLIDNNALVSLGNARRANRFFRQWSRIPSEVLHESEGLRDHAALTALKYPDSGSVLRHLLTVMSSVPPLDTSLVDLYGNKGAADPLLVACVLDAMEKCEESLLEEAWTVVTDDKAVHDAAGRHGVSFMSAAAFAEVVDGA